MQPRRSSSSSKGLPLLAPLTQRLAVSGATQRPAPVAMARPQQLSSQTDQPTASARPAPSSATLGAPRKIAVGTMRPNSGPTSQRATPKAPAVADNEGEPIISEALSAEAMKILSEINTFDFGGKLGDLFAASAQDEDDDTPVAATAPISPSPPRQPKVRSEPTTTSASPRTLRVAERVATATSSSAGHEMACGGDEPWLGQEEEPGALGALKPVTDIGLPTERSKHMSGLSHVSNEDPDVIVMAQKITLLSNYEPHGGPLINDANDISAPATGLRSQKGTYSKTSTIDRYEKRLYFTHLLSQINLRSVE